MLLLFASIPPESEIERTQINLETTRARQSKQTRREGGSAYRSLRARGGRKSASRADDICQTSCARVFLQLLLLQRRQLVVYYTQKGLNSPRGVSQNVVETVVSPILETLLSPIVKTLLADVGILISYWKDTVSYLGDTVSYRVL